MRCSGLFIFLIFIILISTTLLVHWLTSDDNSEKIVPDTLFSIALAYDVCVPIENYTIPEEYKDYNMLVIKAKTRDVYTEELNQLCGDDWKYVCCSERYSNEVYHYLAKKDVKEKQ